MGRAKLQLKLIENQRQRASTYRKRLQSLKKKTFELATLCDVPALMLCFDPSSGKVETCPENVQEVRNIIEMYNGLSTKGQERNKVYLSGFFQSGLRKQQLHISRKRGCFGDNSSDLSPDNGSPKASMEFLDSKLGMIRQRIQLLRNQTCLQGDAKGLGCFEEHMVFSLEQYKQDSSVCNLYGAALAVDPIDWNQSVSLSCSGAPFNFEMCADACAFGESMEYVGIDDFIDPYVEQQKDLALPAFDVIDLPPLSFEGSSELFPWESSCGEYDTDLTSFGALTTESSSVTFDRSQLATSGNGEQFETCADACAFGEPMEYVGIDDFIDPYVEQPQDLALPAFDVIDLPPLSFEGSSELFPWESSCGEYDTDLTSFGALTTESSSVTFDRSQLATSGNGEQFCSSEFGLSDVHYQMTAAENSSGMFDSNQFVNADVEEQFCAPEFGFGGVHCQMPQAECSIDIYDEYHLMLTSGRDDQANYDRGMQAASDDFTYGPLSLWD